MALQLNQELQNKYPHLEVSVLKISEVKNNNDLFRLEAEYNINYGMQNKTALTGKDIISFSQYGTSKELNEEEKGFPVLRINEFNDFFIGTPTKYCDKIDYETFKSLQLKKGDVLISRTNGNPNLVGKAAIVMEDMNYAYASYLFKIRTNNYINPETLVVFLRSKYGRKEINKYSMTSNQTNFSPAKFR